MTPTPETIGEAILRFIRSEFRIPAADRSLHRDVQLYDSGFVDSAGVVELIVFLESTFDVALQDEDIFADEFTTINGMSNVIHRRLTGKLPHALAAVVESAV